MRITAFLFITFITSSLQAVCMTKSDAEAYGCFADKSTEENKQCSKAHGSNFSAYYTDNVCTLELAYELRGEHFSGSQAQEVPAACMSYEQGVANGCNLYDYEAAYNYCANNFGIRFIPFIPEGGKCSLETASKLRGESSADVLIEGLASDMEEIETIMTMIDRQGLGGSLGQNKFEVTNEFYTDVVKSLMARMHMFKKLMFERGQLKVQITSPDVAKYINFAFRYLNVQARLYRVYSAAAHENHFVLKTYEFENLDYLNLVLKKVYGLEILAKVNYRSKTVGNGENIEFIIGQQDRQTYEYAAMQDPSNEQDYAKLVTFLGVRENVTNLWGVQRMTVNPIGNSKIRSCGNFLSFRPKNYSMQESDAYTELYEYDIFYNDYFPRQKELAEISQKVSLLDEDSAVALEMHVFNNVSEINKLAKGTGKGLKQLANEDAQILIESENMFWTQFSQNYFPSIVMPGDDVLNKESIIERISEEAFQKRVEAVVETFIASYLWVSDSSIKLAEKNIKAYAEKNLKESFFRRLGNALAIGLGDYLDKEKLAEENKQSKLDQTYKAAEGAAKAAYILNAIKEENLDYGKVDTLEPTSVEELMMLFQARVEKSFGDLKQTLEHNEELSKELANFFKAIKDEFSKKFVKGNDLIGTDKERSLALREIAFKAAKTWIHKYPYVIKAPQKRTFLGRPSYSQKKNTIPVYEDGTPAGLSNTELLEKLENINIGLGPTARKNSGVELLGATDPVEVKEDKSQFSPVVRFRNNPDKLTIGAISRPLEVVSPGKIRTENGYTAVNANSLTRLFESFGVLSKNKKSEVNNANNAVRQKGPKDLVIKDARRFFFRAFEVLDLEKAATNKSFIGRFARNDEAQGILAQNIVSQAYQMAPLLRTEYTWNKTVKKYCFTRGSGSIYSCDYKKEVALPLLEKIVEVGFSPETSTLNAASAKSLIEETLDNAIENANEKVATFCKASFLNYKNDPEFKQVFKASKFLRSSLKSPMGQDPKTVERIKKFDESIKKQVRTRLEAINEDYFEPSLHILGTAAIVALGIVFIVGSGGVAAPGVVGGLFASASTFLAIEFFVSFPLVVGSLYSRINTHFIEVPAQLKFQQSLATSQIDYSKVIDWDMLRADKEEASSQRAWTIGLMPLDFFYGAMLYRHVKVETGTVGKAAFERLTGTKIKGWSAPPSGALKLPSFQQVRRERGLVSAVWSQVKRPVVRIKSYMPRYMPVPENMIRTTALRMGIIRKAEALNINAKPWELLNDLEAHTSKLKSKLQYFEEFVEAEKLMVEKVRLNRALKPGELLKHFKESAISFIPRNLWEKIKSGNVSEIRRFFTRFGDVWQEMKLAQGAVVGERAKNIDSVVAKLKDFQKGVKAGTFKGDDKMRQFLETISDNEILMLEEVAKKSKGLMANFKSVFKDYQKVVHGLRPMSYLSGYPGKSFQQNAVYPQEYFDGEVVNFDYAFTSDSKDLMNFYESLMKHQGLKTEQLNELREQLEKEMGAGLR